MLAKNDFKTRGVIWNILGSSVWGGNSFVMLLLVSRICTVAEIGEFSIAFTTAQILYIIGLFGLDHYQMTDYKEKYSFSCYRIARILSCILVILGCGLFILFLRFEGKKALYAMALTGFMLVSIYSNLYESRFFQKNRLDYSGKCLFFRTTAAMLVFVITLTLTHDIFWAVCLQSVAAFLILLFYIFKFGQFFVDDKDIVKVNRERTLTNLVQECLPLAVTALIMNVLPNISKYGIEVLLDDEFQGYYNMIFMPAYVINLCSQFIFRPLLTDYASLLGKNNIGKFVRLFIKQIMLVITLTVIVAMLAYIGGVRSLGWLYGKSLENYKWELVIIIVGGGILALGRLFYFVFLIMRKQKVILCTYLAGLLIAVIIVRGMILNYGVLGAALSFLLSQLATCGLFLIFLVFQLGGLRLPKGENKEVENFWN